MSGVLLADRDAHQRAKRYGATATFRLTVVDDEGHPLEGVKGNAGFWLGSNNSDEDVAFSDEKGNLLLSGKCKYDGGFSLRKDGYYKTGRTHKFSRTSYDDVEETFFTRKWVPDYVSKEILKKKRNPIPMIAKRVSLTVPHVDTPIGFDLEIMDWLEPYGGGKTLDVYVTLHTKENVLGPKKWFEVETLTLTFPNSYDGSQLCKSDGWSEYPSSYSVNVANPFEPYRDLTSHRDARDVFLAEGSYLVFRVRSVFSSNGELIRCHYGKIYPNILAHVDKIEFGSVYFNPTPNDTNLEFDPKRNLAPKDTYEDRVRSNIHRP